MGANRELANSVFQLVKPFFMGSPYKTYTETGSLAYIKRLVPCMVPVVGLYGGKTPENRIMLDSAYRKDENQ